MVNFSALEIKSNTGQILADIWHIDYSIIKSLLLGYYQCFLYLSPLSIISHTDPWKHSSLHKQVSEQEISNCLSFFWTLQGPKARPNSCLSYVPKGRQFADLVVSVNKGLNLQSANGCAELV